MSITPFARALPGQAPSVPDDVGPSGGESGSAAGTTADTAGFLQALVVALAPHAAAAAPGAPSTSPGPEPAADAAGSAAGPTAGTTEAGLPPVVPTLPAGPGPTEPGVRSLTGSRTTSTAEPGALPEAGTMPTAPSAEAAVATVGVPDLGGVLTAVVRTADGTTSVPITGPAARPVIAPSTTSHPAATPTSGPTGVVPLPATEPAIAVVEHDRPSPTGPQAVEAGPTGRAATIGGDLAGAPQDRLPGTASDTRALPVDAPRATDAPSPPGAAGVSPVESAHRPAAAARAEATAPPHTGTVLRQVFPEITRLAHAGPGTHRLTLTLNPEHLGEVRVTLVVREGGVQVSIAADQARSVLEHGAPELRRLLEQAGATETRIVVRDLAQHTPHGEGRGEQHARWDTGEGTDPRGGTPGRSRPGPPAASTPAAAPADPAGPAAATRSPGRLDRLM